MRHCQAVIGLQPGKPSAGDCDCYERQIFNNDDITYFSVYNVLSSPRVSGCNTLSHSGLATVNRRKRMFYPLMDIVM